MRYLPKSLSNKNKRPVILIDDRERNPFRFGPEFETKRVRLEVGDYTLEGLEDKVVIEKKSGLSELLTDLSGKYRQRFKRFLSRMSQYPIKIMIVQDHLENVTQAIRKLPPNARLTEATLYYWITAMQIDYGIQVFFIGNNPLIQKRYLNSLIQTIEVKII